MTLIAFDTAVNSLPTFQSGDEIIVANILAACSATIENHCRRTFAIATYDEMYSAQTSSNLILLKNRPVQTITRVAACPVPVLTVRNTDTTIPRATVQVASGSVTLTSYRDGVATANTLALASGINALASGISAISGWTASVMGSVYGSWSAVDLGLMRGVFDARSGAFLRLHYLDLFDYQLDAELGELYFPYAFPRGYHTVRVTYTAGFNPVPPEIQQACLELVQSVYQQRELNSNLQSETVGSVSYTVAANKDLNSLSLASKKALDYYRLHRMPAFFEIG